MFKENLTRTSGLPFKVDHTEPLAAEHLTERLLSHCTENNLYREIVVVCIGTDRSTGDALGPLVGSKLSGRLQTDRAFVYGTLEAPVHAVNLKDTMDEIQSKFHKPFLIAVDACLGQLSSVGMITLGNGPLKPGAGVNKVLPEVGNIHMTGIVNVGGFMEYFVLQNTRLSIVMRMADCIADSLQKTIDQITLLPIPEPNATPKPDRFAALRSNLFPFR